jgi:hypothetical protein
LPLFYDMTDKQQDKVVKVITDALSWIVMYRKNTIYPIIY